jgi:hypothetical protein
MPSPLARSIESNTKNPVATCGSTGTVQNVASAIDNQRHLQMCPQRFLWTARSQESQGSDTS